MSSSKIREADLLVEEAEKHLKTGLFKWRPDYDSAASSFQKAALAYKNARAHDKSCAVYIRLAECHHKNGSRFHAGKALEEAGIVCRDMKDLGKAMAHFDHASELYLEDGTPDTAAMCLDRAGKMVQMSHPEWSIASYMKAAGIYENEDQNRFRAAAELIGKVARLQVGLRKYAEAVQSIAHEKKLMGQIEGGDHGASGRLTCALVLLHLHIGDQVRAEQCVYDACENVVGFDEGEEYDALQNLLEAYDQRNQEKASRILNAPLFKYMDTAYAKLARSLRVPGFVDKPATAVPAPIQSSIPTTSTNIKQMSNEVDKISENFSHMQAGANAVLSSGQSAALTSLPSSTQGNIDNKPVATDDFDLC